MRNLLCILMAAVFVVVIVPLRAGAVSGTDLSISVRGGVPEVVGVVDSWGNDDITWPQSSYEVVLPITFDIKNMPVGKYVEGYFSINTSLGLYTYGSSNMYQCQITDMRFNLDDIYGSFYTGKDAVHEGSINDISTVYIDDTLRIGFDHSYYCNSSTLTFIGYITYTVSLINDLGSTQTTVLQRASGHASYTGYGLYFHEYDYPPEKSWLMGRIDKLSNDLVSNLDTFKTAVENKFTTLFTFGRQWTDDIIDAVVGQSGGGGISSAQDELDEQLNSIEVVEQQLSNQVAEKIEVPSVSLNADETGGLRWVITTINSLYLTFNELHVMFACIVFFGIIAVLLFGRRNL